MLIFYIICIIVFLIACTVVTIFLLQGPPYVPSPDSVTQLFVEFAKKYKPKRIVDLGSGDGKVVIALAKAGFIVDGVELNPWLVWRSRQAVKKAGVEKNVTIHWKSFWEFNTSQYDMVVLYVVMHVMPRLEKKLQSELQPNAHIVSKYATFPKLKPLETTEKMRVYRIKK